MLSKQETNRQFAHLICGIFIVFLIKFNILTAFWTAISIVILLIVSVITRYYKIPFVYPIFKKIDRPHDLKKMPGKGTIIYMVGVFVSLMLFPKDIAMASLIILAVSDAIAPLIGQYGSMKLPHNKKKVIEGVVAGVITGFLAAWIFVVWYEALFAAIAAMIAESIVLRVGRQKVDDNIVMPFVAGVVISIIRMIF